MDHDLTDEQGLEALVPTRDRPVQKPPRHRNQEAEEWRASGFDNPASTLELAANDALQRTARSTWAEKARYLQQLFGQRLTAAMTGVNDAKTVGRWIRGQEPQIAHRGRLRDAYHVAVLLELSESRQTAYSWFLGMNPGLDDLPPAQVIAEDEDAGGRRVMKAARSFLATS